MFVVNLVLSVAVVASLMISPVSISGLRYNNQVTWINRKYNGSQSSDNNNSFLSNGVGCLTDGLATANNPFSKYNCWIGWNKSRVPKPYLELILSHDANDIYDCGVGIKTYHNHLNGFSKIKNIKITYRTLINSKKESLLWYVRPQNCPYIYIFMDKLSKGNSVKFCFEYRSSWLLIRQILLLQKCVNQNFDDIVWEKISQQMSPITTSAPSSKQNPYTSRPTGTLPPSEVMLSDRMIFLIRLSASLSAVGVFTLLTIVWCCLKKNNILVDIPLKSKTYNINEEEQRQLANSSFSLEGNNSPLECVSYKRRGEGGESNDEEAMMDTSFMRDPTRNICRACYLEQMKRSRYLDTDGILNRSVISNSETYELESITEHKENYSTPTISHKFDDDKVEEGDETPNESPQHCYLDLPASSDDDLRGKVTKRAEEVGSRNLQTKDGSESSDDEFVRLIQEDIDGKKKEERVINKDV